MSRENLFDNMNHKISKKKIEKIAYDCPNFEFISFVGFANFTDYENLFFRMDSQTCKSINIEMRKVKLTAFGLYASNYFFFLLLKYHINSFIF